VGDLAGACGLGGGAASPANSEPGGLADTGACGAVRVGWQPGRRGGRRPAGTGRGAVGGGLGLGRGRAAAGRRLVAAGGGGVEAGWR